MINIQETSQITKIYLVTNCYGDPNKVYIGKTKNCRKSPHKIKYGDEIDYNYIDEVDSLDHNLWKPLETFWIHYFMFLGFDVINPRKEGGSGPSSCSKETRTKISKKLNKPILQYDSEGNFIQELKSITQASYHLCIDIASISKCCRDLLKTSGSYIFRYKGDELKFKQNIHKNSKPILQYDLNNNFIKRWDNASSIYKELGIDNSDINSCVYGKQKTSRNYIWKFEIV